MAADVDDAGRVLNTLAWEKAYVVGHSWGGQLALHVAEALPDRVLGVLAVEPLGSVGDGCWPEFDREILRRTPEAVRERAHELDELITQGAADDELALEAMRLVWPAYFADPAAAPPMPELPMFERTFGSDGAVDPRGAVCARDRTAEHPGPRRLRPRLAKPDAGRRMHGRGRAYPPRLGRAQFDGAGHFVWVEAPGPARFARRFGASPAASARASLRRVSGTEELGRGGRLRGAAAGELVSAAFAAESATGRASRTGCRSPISRTRSLWSRAATLRATTRRRSCADCSSSTRSRRRVPVGSRGR